MDIAVKDDYLRALEEQKKEVRNLVMSGLERIMREVNEPHENDEQSARDRAFEELEKLRRKFPDLDYDKELESYREEKY